MKKILLTTKKVKLIGNKKIVIIAFNLDYKAFIVYIVIFNISFKLDAKIHFSKMLQ